MELTQEEQITLKIFTADTGAYEAVKKVGLDYINRQKEVFLRNLAIKKELSNEEVGARIRAFDEAALMVEGIFRELGLYGQVSRAEDGKNPAR